MDEKNLLLGLREHRDEIVRRWAQQVKKEMADGHESNAELQNHIPDFLDGIENALNGDDRAPLSNSLQARAHGKQRHRIGFDLKTVVQEYGMLRNVILDVVGAAGVHISFLEVRRLSDCILAAIADAVDEHSNQEKQTKDQAHTEQLKQLQERAEFEQYLTGIVSHDLRNPLSAITLIVASLQRHAELDKRVERGLERISKAAERSLRLVADLLDFTRIRLGSGIPVDRKPCSLLAIVQNTAEEVSHARPAAQIQVTCHGDPNGEWDADRLAQMIQNLLVNALEHAEPASAVRIDIEDHGAEVKLACTNAGYPVGQDNLKVIFEPMQRGKNRERASKSGLGLGLYIVRHIARAHGGDVAVASAERLGTTFTARLPRCENKPTVSH